MAGKKVKARKVKMPKLNSKPKVPGPMENLGTALGYLGGGILGAPRLGSQIGKYAGRTVGWITGTGDYVTNYGDVSQNACMIPSFKGADSTVISKREYIGDVLAGTGSPSVFTQQSYPLNPGQSSLFPWMSMIAANYEQYDIQGMVFEFKSTSGDATGANTALGTVIMATQYDPTKPVFQSKLEMEDYYFSTSCKPSTSMLHAIECKDSLSPTSGKLYTRTGALTGTDLRWTDFGRFTIATQGMPNALTNLGELWVSYKVKLIKPRLPITIGYGGQIASGHIYRTGVSSGNAGTVTALTSGPLPITFSGSNTFTFPAIPQMNYIICAAVVAATSVSGLTFGAIVNLANINLVENNSQPVAFGSASSNRNAIFGTFTYTGLNPGNASINVAGTATIVGSAQIDIIIIQFDETTIV